MADIDVEALLDATATEKNGAKEETRESEDRMKIDRPDRKDRDRSADRGGDRSRRDRSPGRSRRDRSADRARGERDRDRDRERERDRDRDRDRPRRDRADDKEATTPRSDAGSHKSRRRSRSRDDERRHSRRHRGGDGDFYRGGRGGRDRSRTRSPRRHFRRDDHRDRDERGSYRGRDDDRHRGGRTPRRDATPQLTEDERDRRTVFVQQLAARLRTKELKEFFEKVGPVNEAQIVKDRISGRSKGYVFPLPPPPALVVILF